MRQNRFTSKIQKFITTFAFSACLCQSALAQADVKQENQQMSQQKSGKKADNAWLQKQLAEIELKRKQVEAYNPMAKGYLVSYSPTNYVLIAVSPRARTRWLKRENALDVRKMPNNKLDSALAALASAIAEKLPTYRKNLEDYNVRNEAREKLMKDALKNLSTLKIHFIGLRDSENMDSLILPKNKENPPEVRLRFGKIWARDTADDHPYCHLYHFDITQNREGDGSSGASDAKLILDEIVGCPANGK